MDTTVYPISWPRILCLSTNCNIWHLVLCVQRVKLCPIKIKISTFITLYGLLPNEDPAVIVTFQALEVPSFTNYNLTGPADAVQILVWIISLCLNMDLKKKIQERKKAQASISLQACHVSWLPCSSSRHSCTRGGLFCQNYCYGNTESELLSPQPPPFFFSSFFFFSPPLHNSQVFFPSSNEV